ncbi:MAG: threonine synthase [Clostridia bacterium]|nr:threonine synthase [Clostridia bacterium]
MNFIGTRKNDKVTAYEAVVKGYAKEGGLYVPESFPVFSAAEIEALTEADYPERAAKILARFFDGEDEAFFTEVCKAAYAAFDGSDPAPLLKIDDGRFVLELFHGPTCSEKDFAARIFPEILKKCAEKAGVKEEPLLVAASAGDSGKALLEAFKNEKGVKVAAFYSDETSSKLQRFSLSVQQGKNVFVAGVRGTVNDCVRVVRRAVLSEETKEALKEKNMAPVSAEYANILSVLSCVPYYFSAYADLLSSEQIEMGEPVNFAIPAGDFCSVLACFYAKKMGLPVGKILSASNRNRALWDFLRSGTYDSEKRAPAHTMSPSLDILWAGNAERLVYEACGRDCKLTASRMKDMEKNGVFSLSGEEFSSVSADFQAGYASEDDTVESMYDIFEEYGYAMDTHTGVAAAVMDKYLEKRDEKDETPVVITAVANPYKFPQDVLYALSGNDVKDSYKGVKRLNLLTAMKPPKGITEMRYKPLRFKAVLAADEKKIAAELLSLSEGKIVPEPVETKR